MSQKQSLDAKDLSITSQVIDPPSKARALLLNPPNFILGFKNDYASSKVWDGTAQSKILADQ